MTKPPFNLKHGCTSAPVCPPIGVLPEWRPCPTPTLAEPANFGTPDTTGILGDIKASSMLLRQNAGFDHQPFDVCGFKVICSGALPDDTMIVGKQVFLMLKGVE